MFHTNTWEIVRPFVSALWVVLLLTLVVFTTPTSHAMPLAVTEVSGDITTNTTWTLANSPYLLTDNIRVEAAGHWVC